MVAQEVSVMRLFTRWVALLLPTAILIGCGGGGGGPDAGGVDVLNQKASMEGIVLDVDGESAQAGGVAFVVEETGARTTTGVDGSFAFDELPEGEVNLVLDTANSLALSPEFSDAADDVTDDEKDEDEADDSDDENDKDEAADDSERDDRRIRIRRVRRGELIIIHIRIVSRRIVDVRIVRPADDVDGGCEVHERELELEMRRTDANTDPDMEGEVELSIESNCDQEFEVEVEDATVGDILEAVVINPDDEEDSLGFRVVELDGDAEWKIDTGDGQSLPFGKTRITGLGMHRVVVRDADGVDLLRTRIPRFHDGDPDCFFVYGRARLIPKVEGVAGWVGIAARGCIPNDRDRLIKQLFRVYGEGLMPGRAYDIFLEDPDDPGTLVVIRTMTANRDGEVDLAYNTGEGDRLPLGAGTIRVLVGKEVQIRVAATDRIVLRGKVPMLMDGQG